MNTSARTRAPSAIGALVAGGDYQGLGIVRSLGRRGVPVCVIDDEPSISRFSRFTTRAIRVSDLRDEPSIVATMSEIGDRFGLEGWVVYPTRDEIVAALSRHRGLLSEFYRVPTPDWDVVRWAWDKRLTYRMAGELGIATPNTRYASDDTDLTSLALRWPIVIKPAIKQHFIYAANVKALRADSAEQLATRFDEVRSIIPTDEVMLQELIPGGGDCQFSYCAFFKDGRPLAKMLVRRARQRPPDFARSSTCVETVDMPELEEPSERFLGAIGYYGLVEIEYKLDRRDGQYKLLDVNPRTWGSHAIGRRAGADFPWLLFRDQLGDPVEPTRARPGIRWIRLTTDLPTSLVEILHGRLDWRTFAKSISHFQMEAVFDRDDPLPALAELTLLPHLVRTRGGRTWIPGTT
jgi:predicted ATP-grasp superfamily ATP-dependent carboligase